MFWNRQATLLMGMAVTAVLPFLAEGRIRERPLPPHLKRCYEQARNLSLHDVVGGQYSWYCEAPLRAHLRPHTARLPPDQAKYIEDLYSKVEVRANRQNRDKRQIDTGMSRCERQECRRLSSNERQRLWDAFNALKRDRSVFPNKYDALARYHTGQNNRIAHGGPGFLGWHRIYLLIIEQALREMDPGVCLCYWDSSLDGEMRNPTQCSVWSNDFFGNGNGPVTSGPFANWITLDGSRLLRSLGVDGQPMSRRGILAILSQRTYEDITSGDRRFNLEGQHGAPHIFVGGDMESLGTAANDPVFFLHHCFVDYLFEVFRRGVRDPERYPSFSDRLHAPTQRIIIADLRQADGYRNIYASLVSYESSPSCATNTCQGPYLDCSGNNVCTCLSLQDPRSRSKRQAPPAPPAPLPPMPAWWKPATEAPATGAPDSDDDDDDDNDLSCARAKPQAYQNSFCVDGRCDVNQWVWLPVKIITQRPPEFTDYGSRLVRNGQIGNVDIYEPSAYSDTSQYIKPNKPSPKAYDHCSVKDGVGKIFVSSQGLSYDGYYKESSIVDQRLATSVSVAYIAVKDPGKGKSEVLLRAHDQCGRLCQVACLVPGSKPPKYRKCSGVIQVTAKTPKMYGQTYAAATLLTYDYQRDTLCPSVKFNDVFTTFFCDYVDYLPWLDNPTKTERVSSPAENNTISSVTY